MYGAVAVVPVSDGAAYFDGSNDYINCGNGASTNIGDVDMSYSAWIYIKESSPGEYIVSTRNNSVGEFSLYLGTDRKLQFYKGTAGQDKSTTVLDVNKWYHVAVVYDQSELDCFYYVNGVADGSDTSVTGSVNDASDLYFGFREDGSSSHYYNGYICNVGFWTKSLTQPEIKSIMNKNYAGLTDSEKTNLVSWWNLDSNIGDTTSGVPTGAAHVYDNHHGGGESLGSELISNTTFDNNITGWVDYSTGTVSHETSIVYSGNGALRTTNDGAGNIWLGRYPSGNISGIEANTSYLVTGRAYIPTGWDGGDLYFTDGSSFGGDESFIKADSSTLDQWQESTMVVNTASDITGSLYLRCASNPSADKYVIWDSISMKKINGNTGVCK